MPEIHRAGQAIGSRLDHYRQRAAASRLPGELAEDCPRLLAAFCVVANVAEETARNSAAVDTLLRKDGF